MDQMLFNWFRLAVAAPSSANLQPWYYVGEPAGEGWKITLSICPKVLASPPALDPTFLTVTISIGCFVKNLEIAAALDGFKCKRQEKTGSSPSTWRWVYHFFPVKEGELNRSYDESTLLKRVSNRTLYDKVPMDSDHRQMIQKIVDQSANLNLFRIVSEKTIWIQILSKIEKVRLCDYHFCSDLFNEFRSKSEMQKDPIGLPIETATNSLWQRCFLFLLKKSRFLRLTLIFGGHVIFSWLSLKKPLINSGEIFLLQSNTTDPTGGVDLGKTLEEIWLKLTSLGYSMQVIGLPILIFGNRNGSLGSKLSEKNRDALDSAKQIAKEKLGVDLSLMTLLFRVGKAKKSTPHSLRRKINL